MQCREGLLVSVMSRNATCYNGGNKTIKGEIEQVVWKRDGRVGGNKVMKALPLT